MNGQYRNESRTVTSVIGTPIDSLSWETALSRLADWASSRQSRYICICNAHSVVTARHDQSFGKVVREADMATPDGAPVAWLMRKQGAANQHRINGPDFMWRYCAQASARDESIYLYGGQQKTLELLQARLLRAFPGLKIAGAYSPPYRALTSVEDEAVVDAINNSGAGTVWVSLGCPKQEKWMAEHRGRINATMIGVGAAFDYHAGTIKRAPLWMQRNGLEWLHRVCSEPRRLWRRYLVTNSLFILHAAQQLLLPKATPVETLPTTAQSLGDPGIAPVNISGVAAGHIHPSLKVADLVQAIAEKANQLSLEIAMTAGSNSHSDAELVRDIQRLTALTEASHGSWESVSEITRLIYQITAKLEGDQAVAKPTAPGRADNVLLFPTAAVIASRELSRLSAELSGVSASTTP